MSAGASRLSWDVALAVLYVLAIFVVGSLPGAPPVGPSISDKIQHAIGFALLAWLWCRALKRLRPESSLGRILLGGFLVSAGVGGVLELWQALLTYRTCEFLDWVADGVGAAVAVVLYAVVQRLSGARPWAAE
jgi:VanZ family protein